MAKMATVVTWTGRALVLACLASCGGDGGGVGRVRDGGGLADAGVPAPDGGAPTLDGGSAAACEENGDFSGPQLRDCDLPGACGSCMWEKACTNFLFRCAHNEGCVCMAECVASTNVAGTTSCLGQCGLTEIPPGFAEWVKGASDMCWDEGCGRLDEPTVGPSAANSEGSPGAGTDPDCVFDTNLTYDPCGPVLQLESADKSLCARIERRNDGAGDNANVHWTLLDVRLGPLGQVCHASEASEQCWFSSHHNYIEWLHISCGGLHYDLNIGTGCGKQLNPDSTFVLHVFEDGPAPVTDACNPTADGTCSIVAPIDLFPVE